MEVRQEYMAVGYPLRSDSGFYFFDPKNVV
jgi:hypothetical protein